MCRTMITTTSQNVNTPNTITPKEYIKVSSPKILCHIYNIGKSYNLIGESYQKHSEISSIIDSTKKNDSLNSNSKLNPNYKLNPNLSNIKFEQITNNGSSIHKSCHLNKNDLNTNHLELTNKEFGCNLKNSCILTLAGNLNNGHIISNKVLNFSMDVISAYISDDLFG